MYTQFMASISHTVSVLGELSHVEKVIADLNSYKVFKSDLPLNEKIYFKFCLTSVDHKIGTPLINVPVHPVMSSYSMTQRVGLVIDQQALALACKWRDSVVTMDVSEFLHSISTEKGKTVMDRLLKLIGKCPIICKPSVVMKYEFKDGVDQVMK